MCRKAAVAMQWPFLKMILMARQRSFTGNFSGVQGRFDVNLEVDNREFVDMLERLRYENIVKSSDIRKVFARVAKPVKMDVQKTFRSLVKSDPRKTWMGVRIITLKKGKGVVIGLLNPRKASGRKYTDRYYIRGGKSGIIRYRDVSRKTIANNEYFGSDRSFILRMLNQGTKKRIANVYDNALTRRSEANRGELKALRFFDRAEPGMKQASKSLAQELGKIIEKKANKS